MVRINLVFYFYNLKFKMDNIFRKAIYLVQLKVVNKLKLNQTACRPDCLVLPFLIKAKWKLFT